MGPEMKAPRVLFLVLVSCLLFQQSFAAGAPYTNPNLPVEARVKDLLGRMTVDEKIGQMIQIERSIATPAIITQYYIGSILSGGGSVPAPNATAAQWANMTDTFQTAALSTRLKIPFIYGIDAVHGHNNVYGATIFPHNVGLGCTRDPDLLMRIGSATALEVRATGIQYTFAPCIAVCRDPRWGRCYESYSEDPSVVSNMTTIIDGLQGKAPANWTGPYLGSSRNVAACAKHFVGDGGTVNGIDEGNTVIDYNSLVNIHMKGYPAAIAKGVSTIMVSYSAWNGVKMHANRFLLTDVLKNQLGFKGFLISDWEGIDRITPTWGSNYSYSVLAGVTAGIDMFMLPFEYQLFTTTLKKFVTDGTIPMSRINDAVTRILRVKFANGLFEKPYSDPSLRPYLGAPAHRLIAREAVRKSLVLLKNAKLGVKNILPLAKNASKILVVGAHANDIGLQCGGWTMGWQGSAGSITKGTTILEGIQQTVSPTTKVVYNAAPVQGYAKGKGFKYAVVVVGEQPYAEYYGDNSNLTLSATYLTLIQDTCSNVPCVVIMVSGRPLVVEPILSQMNALVAAWLPGTEGRGVADVLFGDFDFQGKLSRTWFRRANQLPMNVGDKNYDPLFPFGFGLKQY